MVEIRDETGFISEVKSTNRIVSLVPSLTELLYDLGLQKRIAGVTEFCISPEATGDVPKIGGTKTVDINAVLDIDPDLVIATKEENVSEQIENLRQKNIPVFVADIKTYQDNIAYIEKISEITGAEKQGEKIVNGLQQFIQVKGSRKTVAYFIWNDPMMVAGGDTFIHAMLERCGFQNYFEDLSRYPRLSGDAISPDFIFLSTEPFAYNPAHIYFYKRKFPHSHPVIVDGAAFSWYGSHPVKARPYLTALRENLK